ncbi:LacI family DNA-binding transcriptional regulator [Roseomonas marmotae]|uniref:LacI family DNA-binding transcriptional regulator n=1 Tax=Roseomonas marmotae TaxID=2768161 RepID=A0ABS3KIH3_9PROT|nr:LacI family DNA-binding transcriptional regulator [Roseomonas marmotae]MBO1076802.1 LacI family DNA-binding transcriptional regulator [Roseomonas marmotae]QTI78733.1 LacI family DNA-binding transcriptional regulator [Roseomonas marmotae]
MLKRTVRVTLLDVARQAGVSRATASLVLRNSPLVAAETRARVQAAAQAVGYLYNRGAATLRGQRTSTVGLLVTEIDNPFFGELIAGAEAALDAAGYIAFLATTAESVERQERTLQRLREHGVDGLILCAAHGTPAQRIAQLAGQGPPCVQVMRQVRGSGGDFAGPDNRLGLDLLTEHLIARGHRRIAFAGAAVMHSGIRQRLDGVAAALRRHGLPPPVVLRTPATRAGGAEAAHLLHGMEPPPTAMVCCNDVVAFGAIPVLERLGLRVGRDIAVTGVGDVPEAAIGDPPLTTLATEPRRIGQEAVRLLLRRINDPAVAAEQVVIPSRLVIRASSAAGPAP